MNRTLLSSHLLLGSGLLFTGFIDYLMSYAGIGQRIEKNGTLTAKSLLFTSALSC